MIARKLAILRGPILPYLDDRWCSTCRFAARPVNQPPCRECRGRDQWQPTQVFMYWWELRKMDEYSCTLPTGTTNGKVWKCRTPYGADDHSATFHIGLYIPDFREGYVGIVWMDVVLRHGPEPRSYSQPDWSNYQQWLRDHEIEP